MQFSNWPFRATLTLTWPSGEMSLAPLLYAVEFYCNNQVSLYVLRVCKEEISAVCFSFEILMGTSHFTGKGGSRWCANICLCVSEQAAE